LVSSAVASVPADRPWLEAALRLVTSPAKTPPATGSGGPLKGAPLGSVTETVPVPALPVGALASQGRPKALLSEIPSGRLTDTSRAVAAAGLNRLLAKAALLAA
jgi:hypothetical protein